MDEIVNKVVIITGASSGIGEATAKLLAKQGAKVVLGARRVNLLDALTRQINDAGGTAISQVTDVTVQADLTNLVKLAMTKYGKVDVIFNNAGLMPLSELAEGKVSEWDRMIDVNIKGVLYGINAVLPIMKKQGYGQVITTDSVAGHMVSKGAAVYSGTKFAIQAIMEGLRKEEGINGIRTSMVSPGAVATELYSTITNEQIRADIFEKEQTIGLTSDDIARAVSYVIAQPAGVNVNEILVRPTKQLN